MHARFEKRIEEGLSKLVNRLGKAKKEPDRTQVERQIGRLLGKNSRAAGLFDIRVDAIERDGRPGLQVTWTKKEQWRQWAVLSEGCYLLRTNLRDRSAQDLWQTYIQLTQAESAFRTHKSELGLRPIWHQTRDRVQAHILFSFLAYAMCKTLEEWMARSRLGHGVRTVIEEIARMVHDAGGLVYIDGANMNAIMGVSRPGDFGGDMMHFNVHKTFTGPHGAGGPGAGPIAVQAELAEFLPGPVVARDQNEAGDVTYRLETPPQSIGRVRSFFGNVGILVRGYCYLRTLGPEGVRDAARHAVLNANYLKACLNDTLPVPHAGHCMHEFVASAERLQKEMNLPRPAMDIAKRLLDYGFHPPTVYFPLTVNESIMIEPTETENRQELDLFIKAMKAISIEAKNDPNLLMNAPHLTRIKRLDEVRAARNPILRWKGTKTGVE